MEPAHGWFTADLSVEDPLYACVHAPEFPAQALLRLRPHLRRGCVAVLEGVPPHEQVCALNTQARRGGLRNGMTRVEAESFGAVTLLPRSPGEEERARAALLACAGGFTPMAELSHTPAAILCVLDVRGMRRLHATPQAFAAALRRALAASGLHVSVAVSANFHAACALARNTSGITVAAPGEERAALASLPLPVLDLSEEQAATLALWGIHTLGSLAALPVRELVARMGQEGRRLHALARGEHPHLFAPAPPAWELREQIAFDAPVRVLQSILFVLGPMLDRLLAQARERLLALATVTVRLTFGARALDTEEDGRVDPVGKESTRPISHNRPEPAGRVHPRVYQRTVRPTVPTQNKRLLMKLLQLDLEAHPPGAPVLAVALEATAAKTGAMQAGLFAPPLPEPSRLDVTLARLTALVGEGRVGAPVLRDTYAPDSFTVSPFCSEPVAVAGESASPTPALRQLRPPEPVTIYLEAGRPARFAFRGELFHVRSASGPWRMSGAWWEPEHWAHECWDVAAEPAPARLAQHGFTVHTHSSTGLCCRLRRDLQAGGAWFMEGMYD